MVPIDFMPQILEHLWQNQIVLVFVDYTLDRDISPITGVSVVDAVSNDTTPDVTVSGIDMETLFIYSPIKIVYYQVSGFGIAADELCYYSFFICISE